MDTCPACAGELYHPLDKSEYHKQCRTCGLSVDKIYTSGERISDMVTLEVRREKVTPDSRIEVDSMDSLVAIESAGTMTAHIWYVVTVDE